MVDILTTSQITKGRVVTGFFALNLLLSFLYGWGVGFLFTLGSLA